MVARPRLTAEFMWARLRSIAVVAGLAVVATAAWSSVLALPAPRLIPVTALAAAPALVAAVFLTPRVAVAAMLMVVPPVLLVAGLPVGALAPGNWPRLVAHVSTAPAQAIMADGHWGIASASLAAVMIAAGVLWTAGAALGVSGRRSRDPVRAGRVRGPLAFALLTGPWLAALIVRTPSHSAWQGAVVLVAGVLWFCAGAAPLSLAVAVAVPSAALASAVGPRSSWFGLAGLAPPAAPFSTLYTEPTYGPLIDRRTGATMLIVTAPRPALWRMQTLGYYEDGYWTVDDGELPELPEPAARNERVHVQVAGLRENLVVAPGRIDRVSGPGKMTPIDGGAVALAPMPGPGTTYDVESSDTQVTAEQLAQDRAPLDPAARAYTQVGPTPPSRSELRALERLLGPLADLLPADTKPPVDPRVVALAQRLASGARTEWEIVTRVERYLLDSGRFRYTTDVGEPGLQPLVHFLLRTHAGYCQHFAGAAALLLRLAGVPARVVVGFATGTQVGPDRYLVRDVDAHQWIEVYFEGYGWVPFNPTPTVDPAAVAGTVDTPPRAFDRAGSLDGLYLGLALVAAAAVGALSFERRRRPTRADAEWVWRVARRAGCELAPSTTLRQIRVLLAVRVGASTAGLAAEIERERFAAGPHVRPDRGRMRVAHALLSDVGLVRALRFWVRVPRRVRPH
jgi:transglutaminase-like putative cysteine protease